MADETRKPILQDHVKVKRKLVPSFVNKLEPKLSQYSWTRQLVPEALWLGLVIDHCGYEAARGYCGALGHAACASMNRPDRPMFVKFSVFAELSEAEKDSMRATLDQSTLSVISRSLAPLTAEVPDHPLAFLTQAPPEEKEKVRLPKLLRELYDRNSRVAVLSAAIGYEMGIDQGKIHIAPAFG